MSDISVGKKGRKVTKWPAIYCQKGKIVLK